LQARDWNLEKAETLIRDCLVWRAKEKPHLIKEEEISQVKVRL
jgi:hypothetical protein